MISIRQMQRELDAAALAAKAGGSFAADHRRRAHRLRKQIMDAKFYGVRSSRPSSISHSEAAAAAQIDALVEHFPSKVKIKKVKPIQNFRQRDFDNARRSMQRKQTPTIVRAKGMFKLGEEW